MICECMVLCALWVLRGPLRGSLIGSGLWSLFTFTFDESEDAPLMNEIHFCASPAEGVLRCSLYNTSQLAATAQIVSRINSMTTWVDGVTICLSVIIGR